MADPILGKDAASERLLARAHAFSDQVAHKLANTVMALEDAGALLNAGASPEDLRFAASEVQSAVSALRAYTQLLRQPTDFLAGFHLDDHLQAWLDKSSARLGPSLPLDADLHGVFGGVRWSLEDAERLCEVLEVLIASLRPRPDAQIFLSTMDVDVHRPSRVAVSVEGFEPEHTRAAIDKALLSACNVLTAHVTEHRPPFLAFSLQLELRPR